MALIASCQSFLDVKLRERFPEDKVFGDEQTIQQALNGIYLQLASEELYGNTLSMGTLDVMGQYYITYYNSRRAAEARYAYRETGPSQVMSLVWQRAYSVVMNLNTFITRLTPASALGDGWQKEVLLGEAYGLRAFMHVDLLRLFGPVYVEAAEAPAIPYMDQATDVLQPVLSAEVVAQRALGDIEKALALLRQDPVRASEPAAVPAFYRNRHKRFNYFAVLQLKARLLLYMGRKEEAGRVSRILLQETAEQFPWTSAEQQTSVRPDPLFASEVLFGLSHPSLIQQYLNLFDNRLSRENILTYHSNLLFDLFRGNVGDYRYISQWETAPDAEMPFPLFVKYRPSDGSGSPLPFVPLMRRAEIYLIGAESTTDRDSAISLLNELKLNRGEPEVPGTVAISEELYSAYRREFVGEGQFFFFLKRTNRQNIPDGNYSGQMITMDKGQYVVPLPAAEIQVR